MAEPIKGPYKYGYHGKHDHSIWTADGQVKIADIRGWGHLIGQGVGGLNLPPEEAAAIQDATANLLATSWEMRQALEAGLAAYKDYYDMSISDFEVGADTPDDKAEVRAYNLMRQALASAKGETP